MNNNQKIIDRVRRAVFAGRERRARARAHAKAEDEQTRAGIELFLDDLAAEGLDVNTPLGMAIAVRAIAEKRNVGGAEYKSALDEGLPDYF